MKKSVIAATAVIVIAAALVASFAWYGDDAGDEGTEPPENTGPTLMNYINTSSLFEAYLDDARIDVFQMPYALELRDNTIELRPTDHVTGVTDNGDGSYAFTLSTEPGATYTLTVEFRGVTNLASSVSGTTIALTFDAEGVVTLILDANVYNSAPPGGIATLTGYDITGSGWSLALNGKPIDSYTFPSEIPATGNLLQIIADPYITGVYPSNNICVFLTEYDRAHYIMTFDLGDSSRITSLSYDRNTHSIIVVFDCVQSAHITVHSQLH